MKIVGVVGSGMIGNDPWDIRCWSGSSKRLWMECKRVGVLQDAIGIEVDKWTKAVLAMKNFSWEKRLWRSRFNLDPEYYHALTQEMKRRLSEYSKKDIILQIGGHYNSAIACPDSFCCSYHDGNAIQLSKSPFFDIRLKDQIQKAIQYEREVYEGLDMIFTMSKYLKKSFIEDYNVPPEKVHCIGVGVNIPVPSEIETFYEYKEHGDKKVYDKGIKILFVGVDFERKGGRQLLTAFNRIKKSPEKINFVGYLDKRNPEDLKTLIYYYDECHLGILPSLYEPFGIVIPEMMFYSIPVIATNNWAVPEIVIQNTTGSLLYPTSAGDMIDEIEQALEWYLDDIARIINQGRKARKYVKNTYTWKKTVENLLFLIDSKIS